MRYALTVFTLLLILSASGQSDPRWALSPNGKTATGPADDVFEWATFRATVNKQKRDIGQKYLLLSSENIALRQANHDQAGEIMALTGAKEEAVDKWTFYAVKYNECQEDGRKWNWSSFGVGTGTGICITVVGLVLLASQL